MLRLPSAVISRIIREESKKNTEPGVVIRTDHVQRIFELCEGLKWTNQRTILYDEDEASWWPQLWTYWSK